MVGQEQLGDDLRLTVLTSQASTWALGVLDTSSIAVVCPPETTGSAGFFDVDGTHRPAIDCVGDWGIVDGTTSATFSPAQPVTRGQMASLLARLLNAAGVELPAGSSAFTDIDGHTHEAAIEQLVAAGLVQGITTTTYGPDVAVSRAQMASFLGRAYLLAAGQGLPPGAHPFEDVAVDSVHEDAIAALVRAGIANGTTATSYEPGAAVNRAQAASFIARLLNRLGAEGRVPIR